MPARNSTTANEGKFDRFFGHRMVLSR